MNYIFFILTTLFVSQACSRFTKINIPSCPKLNENNHCYAALTQIAPTQMNIGLLPIEHRTSKILKESRQNELNKYIDKRKTRAIKGPDGKYYILDRHHLAASLYYSPISYQQKKILVDQIDDQSAKDRTEFLNWMDENNYLYLKNNGKKMSPEDLPREVSELTNDSYRGLIWLAIRTNTIKKPKDAANYFEFSLAEQIRKEIDLSRVRPRVREDYLPYLKEVKKILSP